MRLQERIRPTDTTEEQTVADRKYSGFLVSGISLPPDANEQEACDIAASDLKRAGVDPARIRFSIYKRSVDARKRNDKHRISPLVDGELKIVRGSRPMSAPPVVVGMGPAGLFGALLLAENGYAPIIIDRGDNVRDRSAAYERFKKFGLLDVDSNIQFGAGGAGTFSDGKLLTRINDEKIGYASRSLAAR